MSDEVVDALKAKLKKAEEERDWEHSIHCQVDAKNAELQADRDDWKRVATENAAEAERLKRLVPLEALTEIALMEAARLSGDGKGGAVTDKGSQQHPGPGAGLATPKLPVPALETPEGETEWGWEEEFREETRMYPDSGLAGVAFIPVVKKDEANGKLKLARLGERRAVKFIADLEKTLTEVSWKWKTKCDELEAKLTGERGDAMKWAAKAGRLEADIQHLCNVLQLVHDKVPHGPGIHRPIRETIAQYRKPSDDKTGEASMAHSTAEGVGPSGLQVDTPPESSRLEHPSKAMAVMRNELGKDHANNCACLDGSGPCNCVWGADIPVNNTEELEKKIAELTEEIEAHGEMRAQRDAMMKQVERLQQALKEEHDENTRLNDENEALKLTLKERCHEVREFNEPCPCPTRPDCLMQKDAEVRLSIGNEVIHEGKESDINPELLKIFKETSGDGKGGELGRGEPQLSGEKAALTAPETPEGLIWLDYGTCCKTCKRGYDTPRYKEPCLSCKVARLHYSPITSPSGANGKGEGSVSHKPGTVLGSPEVRASPPGTPTCAPAPAEPEGDNTGCAREREKDG